MSVIRKIVSLNDPEYFCNKSWTLSYSFITNSWISFHSYIPNWYIGENNFFYSGVSSCCSDDIDFSFFAGQLVPDPSTTTTTSTFPVYTTSSTTTAVPLSCSLSGNVVVLDCRLEGTGLITVPSPPIPCKRPSDMNNYTFAKGYIITSGTTTIVSTSSKVDACSALNYFLTHTSIDYTPTTLVGQAQNLNVGSNIYDSTTGVDCTLIPTGWYFNTETYFDGTVYEVVNGVVVSIQNCNPATTTTSTTATAVQSFKVEVRTQQPTGQILGVSPSFYTMNPGNTFPVNSGQTKTGIVNTGGSSITINYTAVSPVQIMIVKNNIVVANNAGIPAGTNLFYGYSVSWVPTDEIRVILTKSP